jgi:hypothetical protein
MFAFSKHCLKANFLKNLKFNCFFWVTDWTYDLIIAYVRFASTPSVDPSVLFRRCASPEIYLLGDVIPLTWGSIIMILAC